MRDKEADVQTLVELGISKTHAKVYLALLERGTSTVKVASNLSGVGRPDTYRAMLELKELGLIEIVLSSPAKYKPLPLSEAIAFLVEQKQRNLQELKFKTEKLIENYENRLGFDEARDNSQFALLPKGANSVKKCIAAIESAKNNIDIMTSFKNFSHTILPAADCITEATRRGVKVRFIVDNDSVRSSLSEVFSDFCEDITCSVKHLPTLPQPFIAIYDRAEVQMTTSMEEDFIREPILWSNNPVLVGIVRDYFDSIWFGESIIFEAFENPWSN